jgi:succinoglycan biosynthesis transport protein ExoP
MLWKRKLAIGIVWCAVSIVTPLVVSRIPSIYKAEAVILVDSQKIPDRYVSSTVVTDAQDRLATISQQILSSGRLQKVIEDLDLYHKERQTHYMEEILAMMRLDTEVTPEKAMNGRTASFRVSYQGPEPAVVAQVANKIASLYVEENLKTREIQAQGTSEFIETQLKDAKQKLDGLEVAVSQYKLQHNGELPQQEGSLNGILSRLGVALEANRDALNRAQQQKAMLQDALSVASDSETIQLSEQARDLEPVASAPVAPPFPSSTLEPKRKKSEELQAQLNDLRLRYSDSYPDVKRLRIRLEEAKLEEERKSAQEPPYVEPSHQTLVAGAQKPKPKRLTDSPELNQTRERIASLKSQLDLTNQELDVRKKEQQRILGDISVYQSRVNSLPIREQEMAGLTRDYEITKANYRSLLDKKIAAEMATDMERREKSERFTIVDPARVPARPFKPKREMLDIGGSLIGLALGLALGLGREFQEATLLGEWELPAGPSVLGRLPYIEITPNSPILPSDKSDQSNGKRSRRVRLAILSTALASVLALIAVAGLHFVLHRF